MKEIDTNLQKLVPNWILEDEGTGALLMAVQAGLDLLAQSVERSARILREPESMPEWRLDEVAWEHNLRWYDVNARLEIKRKWIANAGYYARIAGTAEAVRQMLLGVYDDVKVEEWFEYGGMPYHFRVQLAGRQDQEMEAWSKRAVEIVKNVRSVFDGFLLYATNDAAVYVGAGMRRVKVMTIKAVA